MSLRSVSWMRRERSSDESILILPPFAKEEEGCSCPFWMTLRRSGNAATGRRWLQRDGRKARWELLYITTLSVRVRLGIGIG